MDSSGNPSRILLSGDPIAVEGVAGGAVTPGHLMAQAADGDWEVHGTALDAAAPIFAREADLTGGDKDDAYADTDRIYGWNCRNGDVVQAFLQNTEVVVIGGLLESAGDGTLQAITTGVAIAESLEALTATGDTRFKVRVL